MSRTDPEAEGPIALWRWLRWYPLALAVLAGVLWWTWPAWSTAGEADEPERVEVAPPPVVDAEPAPEVEDGEHGPSLLTQGRERAVALENAAKRVAGAFGLRFAEGVHDLREHVGRDELASGGLKAARLTPFVGPYLRYQHARDLYASGEVELQEQARRQTVVALAELSLDVTATGLGHAAAGSEGLLEALEGAVQVADFADFAVSLHSELGSPLGFAGLDALDGKVDGLADRALRDVGGLAPFVDRLLTVEAPEWLTSVPPELVAQARELLDELLAGDEER